MYLAIESREWLPPLKSPASLVTTRIEMIVIGRFLASFASQLGFVCLEVRSWIYGMFLRLEEWV